MSGYKSWINGQPQTLMSVQDRGLAYGDGLFETLRVHRGQPVWLQAHLERLAAGLRRLKIAADCAEIERQIRAYLVWQPLEEGILKLIVTRGAGGRGYSGSGCTSPSVILSAFDLPERSAWQRGIELYPCTVRLGLNPLLAGMKHLNRLEQVLARSEWDDVRFQEGLVLDLRGHLVEGTMSNLFLVRAGRLLTPDLAQAGVAGIARGEILRRAAGWGLSVEVADLGLEALGEADECFCCNSVFGVWPVLGYGALRWSPGPVTRRIQSELNRQLND